MTKLKEVGKTTPGIWKQLCENGFLNEYPEAEYKITEKNFSFPEISMGVISVREEDADRFLLFKKTMKEKNGGSWVVQ